jgi:outer membrane protein insertion porin family
MKRMCGIIGKRGATALLWFALFVICAAAAAAQDQRGPMVTDVQVIGASRTPAGRVLNELRTRQGQPFSEEILRNDIRMLDTTHRYVVGVNAEVVNTPGGVAVVIRVVERATMDDVIYKGAKHLSQEELDKLTGLRKGLPLSPALNRLAARNIEKELRSNGRLFASVEVEEGDKAEDVRVVFRITEGPVVKIRQIRFEGNEFVSGDRLKTQIMSSQSILGLSGEYNPMMLEHDLAKLAEYYRIFGFFDCKVRREIRWNDDAQTVDVVFVIDEGLRYSVKGVQVSGNKNVTTDALLAHNTIMVGQSYNGTVMQAGLKKMQNEYGQRGYIMSRITPEPIYGEQPGDVTVNYQVQEGQPVRAGTINFIGNTVTQDHVIRRQLQIYPGQLINPADIQASERNLARQGIFKFEPERGIAPRVSILEPDVPSEYKDVLVQVDEDRTGSLLFGVGFNSDSGATASVTLNERNFDITRIPTSFDDFLYNRAFRGAGQEFRAEVVPGTDLSRYTVSFREPYLFDTPLSFGASGYYYTRRFNEYDERRAGGRLSLGQRFTPLWQGNISFRGENVTIKNVAPWAPVDILSVQGNNAVFAPRFSLVRDSRDSFLRPTEGSRYEFAYEQGFGDFTFPVVTIDAAHFFTVYERPDGSGRHVIQVKGQAGWAGEDTPVFEKFYAGGQRTLRGFEFRGVGPDKNGFKVGGRFTLSGSVEYQIPLVASDKLYAVVFSDFGTVEENVEIKDFRASVGAGLRLAIPMFGPAPLALDWAFPLSKKDSDDKQAFFIGVALSY